jgi:ubiquinone/menaquinone biosynthesis C-methylase UbiE
MSENRIRFEDGAAYERLMGVWSRLAGEVFLDWIEPAPGLRWADVGCGNAAFTDLLLERCAPVSVDGVDPSEQQLAFARTRTAGKPATFHRGGAEALPFAGGSFDAAIMALVIFFVSDPARGVAEMARVVRPGGLIAAYAWDLLGGGFPLAPLQAELRAIGKTPTMPPSPDAGSADVMRKLWHEAGLESVETRTIAVTRTFADFEDFWTSATLSPGTGAFLAKLDAREAADFKTRLSARLPADRSGRVTYTARANAVKGIKPQ